MATESTMLSVMGKVGRLVSSRNSVVVKTFVIKPAGLSWANGVFDLVKIPTSVDAVDETMRRSCRSRKSLNLKRTWCGGFSAPKGSTGSVIFWNVKVDGGCRLIMW